MASYAFSFITYLLIERPFSQLESLLSERLFGTKVR